MRETLTVILALEGKKRKGFITKIQCWFSYIKSFWTKNKGKWHHICVDYKRFGTTTIYLDGNEVCKV